MLTCSGLEYVSLWVLFIKLCATINQIKKTRQLEEYQVLSWYAESGGHKVDPVLLYPSVLLILVIFYIIWFHHVNEMFFRQFLEIWEHNIKEDFYEEFTKNRKKRCCFELTFVFRHFNYREWISFWRYKGQVVPKSEKAIKDNMQLLFIEFTKKNVSREVIFKQMLLFIIWVYTRFNVRPGGIKRLEVSEFPEGSFETVEVTRDLIDFIGNQILETLLLGTIAQNKIFNWIREGKVLKLGSGWEYPEEYDNPFEESSISRKSIARSRRQSMSAFSKTAGRHNQYTNNNMQPHPAFSESSSDYGH